MKSAYFLLIAIAFTFSACKKDAPDPAPIKNKTITVVFSEYNGQCNSAVKYAGVEVAITHGTDTLYTGTSDADGKVVITEVPPHDLAYYYVKYETPAPTSTVPLAVNYGFYCTSGASGTMNIFIDFQ